MKYTYKNLSKVPYIGNSYAAKFLFVAFLGIHVPLIGLLIVLLSGAGEISFINSIILVLVFTLAATGITLLILHNLLIPIKQSGDALKDYMESKTLPHLPLQFKDEAGVLMTNIQLTLVQVDRLLQENRDLTALLSHDLRAPLNQMQGIIDAIKSTETNEQTTGLLNLMETSLSNQLNLLENLLKTLKNQDVDRFKFDFETCKVEALIEECIAELGTMAKDKQVEFEVYGENFGLTANKTLLKQAVKNVLHNAIKFSFQNHKIMVNFGQTKKNGGFIKIIDTGLGIDADKVETIFDRFTKAGRLGTLGESTTGVGLYLVRQIMHIHGGEITVKSQGNGSGSEFLMTF
ncbi:MAG: sensor histidine kinase [Luteibaculaceae bacterium]